MFERIVAGVSSTETARSVGRFAVSLAERMEAELHLVACYEAGSDVRNAEAHARGQVESLAANAAMPVTCHVMPGDPAEAILDVARGQQADLVVVGNKGMKGRKRVLGSVPNTISHRAQCAVLILPTT